MRRDKPFVWVTWLKGLMSGDDQCEWQIWYKVHNQGYEKTPLDFNSVEWNLAHTLLLRETREKWLDGDWQVASENQNSFKMKWPDVEAKAVISGKPDLIARSDGEMVIVDAKTGKPRTSDRVQVLLYMYLFPLATGENPRAISGQLQYNKRSDDIDESMLTEKFKQTTDFWMRIALQERQPLQTPSESECNFCDIAECSVRIIS